MFGILKLVGVSTIICSRNIYDWNKLNKYMQSNQAILSKAEYDYLFKPLQAMKGYNRVLEFDVAHKKIRDIIPLLDQEHIAENIFNGKNYNYAIRLAENKWLKENEPEFDKFGYTFFDYILEYARKTAYDDGYMPACQDIRHTRKYMYETLYCGKIPNNSYSINYITGIPDQEERNRLIEVDKLYPHKY